MPMQHFLSRWSFNTMRINNLRSGVPSSQRMTSLSGGENALLYVLVVANILSGVPNVLEVYYLTEYLEGMKRLFLFHYGNFFELAIC